MAADRAAKARATRERKAAEQAAARLAAQQRAARAATTRKVRHEAAVQAELELMITDAADRLF